MQPLDQNGYHIISSCRNLCLRDINDYAIYGNHVSNRLKDINNCLWCIILLGQLLGILHTIIITTHTIIMTGLWSMHADHVAINMLINC